MGRLVEIERQQRHPCAVDLVADLVEDVAYRCGSFFVGRLLFGRATEVEANGSGRA